MFVGIGFLIFKDVRFDGKKQSHFFIQTYMFIVYKLYVLSGSYIHIAYKYIYISVLHTL